MIDHVSIAVRDLDRAARFYETVLGAIGYGKLEVRPATVGFGKAYPEFWINLRASMGEIAKIAARMWGCACAPRNWSTPSMRPRSPPAAPPMARRACDRSTVTVITPASSAIPTATASKL